MPLTDAVIRSLKPRDRQYKVADEKGLYLLVTPAGGRLWKLKFRVSTGAYQLNLRILTSYILKGTDATGRRMAGIIHAPSYSALRGRRYGTSRNLYPSAIRAFHAQSVM